MKFTCYLKAILKILKSMALARFQVAPVMELVAKLMENMSRSEIEQGFLKSARISAFQRKSGQLKLLLCTS